MTRALVLALLLAAPRVAHADDCEDVTITIRNATGAIVEGEGILVDGVDDARYLRDTRTFLIPAHRAISIVYRVIKDLEPAREVSLAVLYRKPGTRVQGNALRGLHVAEFKSLHCTDHKAWRVSLKP